MQKNMTRKALRDEWQQKISDAERKYAEYHDLIEEIRSYYRNDRR